MNEKPQETLDQLSDEAAAEIIRSLLHKEGNWVQWGKACQQLQKAGYAPQKIFEETGFQGSQQNLIIVSAQVYESLVLQDSKEEVLSYYLGPRSDVLYEFRILNHVQRAQAALIAYEKRSEVDEARDIARAIKEYSLFSQLPPGFTDHPGDAVAYQYWKLARQKKDLQQRSPLIIQGLKFAHSQSARSAIEKLLIEFTSVSTGRKAPLLPVYRLEQEEELPRIIPLAGNLSSITSKEIEAVQPLVSEEPFRLINVTEKVQLMPVPGWQAIIKAKDPVGVLVNNTLLPQLASQKAETVLAVIDRACLDWEVNSYFLVEKEDSLEIKWFAEEPNLKILGQLILILRPKKIIDENVIIEPWQMDD